MRDYTWMMLLEIEKERMKGICSTTCLIHSRCFSVCLVSEGIKGISVTCLTQEERKGRHQR